MKSLFQSIGIVFAFLVFVAFGLVTMYDSYIAGIALLIVMLVFIVNYVLKSLPKE